MTEYHGRISWHYLLTPCPASVMEGFMAVSRDRVSWIRLIALIAASHDSISKKKGRISWYYLPDNLSWQFILEGLMTASQGNV